MHSIDAVFLSSTVFRTYIMYMVWVFTNQVNKDFACILGFEVLEKS